MRPDEFLVEFYYILSNSFAARLGKIGTWHFGQFAEMLGENKRWTISLEMHRPGGGEYTGYVYRWSIMDGSVFSFIPEGFIPFDTVIDKAANFDSFEQRLVNGGCVIPMCGNFAQDSKVLTGESKIAYEFRLAYTIRQKFADIARGVTQKAG